MKENFIIAFMILFIGTLLGVENTILGFKLLGYIVLIYVIVKLPEWLKEAGH